MKTLMLETRSKLDQRLADNRQGLVRLHRSGPIYMRPEGLKSIQFLRSGQFSEALERNRHRRKYPHAACDEVDDFRLLQLIAIQAFFDSHPLLMAEHFDRLPIKT
ncbi:hypothetical protein D3C80_1907240 [compost metagenome]